MLLLRARSLDLPLAPPEVRTLRLRFFAIRCALSAILTIAGGASAQFVDQTESAGLSRFQISWGAVFGDLDLDGDLDLISGHHYLTPAIYWNDGAGTFSTQTHPQPWLGPIDRHGMLVVSLDSDEDLDILVTHGADGGAGAEPKELYRNDGNGTYLSLAGAGGMSDPQARARAASAADFDGNHKIDVFVAEAPDAASRNSLFRNNGSLSFTDVAPSAGIDEGLGTVGGIWGDSDNDGDPDLLVGGEEFPRPTILWSNDQGIFTDASAMFTPLLPLISGADWGDYDDDGDLDLAIAEGEVGIFDTFSEGDSVSYFFNTRYSDTGLDGLTIPSVADTMFARFRVRAVLDTTRIFLGPSEVNPAFAEPIVLTDEYVGAPTFSPGVDRGTYVWRVAPGGDWEVRTTTPDLNFDTFDGWMTGGAPISGTTSHNFEDSGFTPGGARVWRNDGGTFVETTAALGLPTLVNPRDVSWVDYDNDGDLDLHVVDQGTSAEPNAPDRMFRNDGATFSDATSAEALAGGTLGMGDGGIWGDVDGDLDLDLYLQEAAGPLAFSAEAPNKFLRNEGNRGPALLLQLVGRQSGKSAVGAKVTAFVGARRVHRRVQANAWRGFQDPLAIHLGLAGAAFADSVVVEWPTGLVQLYFGIASGSWRLEEGVEITGAPVPPTLSAQDWAFAGLAPQPARDTQRIALSLRRETELAVTVHDVLGRVVRTIHRGILPAGSAFLEWDGRDERGRRVVSGVYWIRATDGNVEASAKAVRVR